jgi:hypothetical protein
MISAINIFLSHPKDSVRESIKDLYGTDEVLEIPRISPDRDRDLRLLYQQQLRKSAKFVRYFEMGDRKDRIIYCLFFASNHHLGYLKMKEAFWKVDKRAGFCFSDATNPDRLILFEKGDISSLISDISKKFCRKRVFVREIREYTEKETIFLERHMKEVLKQLENQRLIDVENLKADGEKRRRGTFPSDAIVSFNSDVIDCQS